MAAVLSTQRTIGCGEWGFRELPLEEHFRLAGELGFRYLEFGIGGGQPGRLSEQPHAAEVAGLRELGRRHGLATPFCCVENDFTLPEADAHAAMLDKVLEQARAAADCGATHLRVFAGFTALEDMDEACWARMLDGLARTDALCEQLGMAVSIETHGGIRFLEDGAAVHTNTCTTDPQGLARMLREMPARVGFNFDPGNIKAVRPEDATCCLDVIDERINYCHLKDWRRQGDGWVATAVGEDDLDYAALLTRMSFGGVYLIEYEPTHDVVDGIRRSLAHLDRVAPGWSFE